MLTGCRRTASWHCAAPKPGRPGTGSGCPGRLRVSRLPDQQLESCRDGAIGRIGRLLADFEPAQVFVPHRHDGLQDHGHLGHRDGGALGLGPRRRCLRIPGLAVEYVALDGRATARWRRHQGDRADDQSGITRVALGCRVQVALGPALTRKLEALQAYSSQLERRGGDPAWPILNDVSNGDFVRCLTTGREVFRHVRLSGGVP